MNDIVLRPYQQECVDIINNIDPGAYLVVMATGLGKCFAPGTKIMMYDCSSKNVEDIKEGELVMGADGSPKTVCGLSHGYEMMYKIIPKKGDPYIVNESHILSLKVTNLTKPDAKYKRGIIDNKGNHYYSGDIVNISVKDYLECNDQFKHCTKGWRTGINFNAQEVDLDPYLLGVWLGDGSSRHPEITTMEHEVVHEMWKFAVNNNMTVTQKKEERYNLAKTYSFRSNSRKHNTNIFNMRLIQYDLLQNKHIPHEYLYNTSEVRLQLLAGLIDSDGYLCDDKCIVEWSTKEIKMRDDFLFLTRSLGFAAYCNTKYVNDVPYYRVQISGDTSIIPNRVIRKKANARKMNKNVLVHGITVEKLDIGEYYGFELLENDKLFLLSDFTVVHNTVCMSHIHRQGRMLILSHREELVHQPQKYFDCSFGVERAEESSNGEEVISASVQTLIHRLDKFSPDEFDIVVIDECQHSTAPSYRKIIDYFHPRLLLGFTATPNRADGVGLGSIFSKIIFNHNIRWGIQNNYLSDIECFKVDIGYDLKDVKTRMGDYANNDLSAAVDIKECNEAVAEVYREYAVGKTIIFAASVDHAVNISEYIPGSEVITHKTENRAEILERFRNGNLNCIINNLILTEGTDLPMIETVIMARPTKNVSLYIQAVGRGTRLYPGKEKLRLIDLVGASSMDMCTAPMLFGIDKEIAAKTGQDTGLLSDMEDRIEKVQEDWAFNRDFWKLNAQLIDLFCAEGGYNLHGINFTVMGNKDLICPLGGMKTLRLTAEDMIGNTSITITEKNLPIFQKGDIKMQDALDEAVVILNNDYRESRSLWDKESVNKWGLLPASLKQKELILKLYKRDVLRAMRLNMNTLTKYQASILISRKLAER